MKTKITAEQYDNHHFPEKMKWYNSSCSILECINEKSTQTGDDLWDSDEIGFWL